MKKAASDLLLYWDQGILIAEYQVTSLDLTLAQTLVEKRVQFTAGQACAVLIKNQSVMSITKEARDFLSSPEGTAGIIAAALITDTVFKRTLVNFFLKVTHPPIPTQMFNSESKAKEWLMNFHPSQMSA